MTAAVLRPTTTKSALCGTWHALRRVDGLLKAGSIHIVDADLKSYFAARFSRPGVWWPVGLLVFHFIHSTIAGAFIQMFSRSGIGRDLN